MATQSLAKTEDLTAEQEALIDKIAQEYEDFAHCGDQSIDQEKMVAGIDFIYGLADLKPPQIVICESPIGMAQDAKLKKGETIDWLGCGYDSGWTAFYEYFKRIGIQYDDPQEFDKWSEFVSCGVYATVLCENVAFVCPRPKIVKRPADGSLHCPDGPALAWDGDEYYFLNGVAVDRAIVMTPGEKLDANLIPKEQNAEVRRELVRKIGIERVLLKLGSEVIDRQGDMYELVLLNLGDKRKRPFLKMKNPSVNLTHIEGVPPEIKTVKQALAWRNQTDSSPEVLT